MIYEASNSEDGLMATVSVRSGETYEQGQWANRYKLVLIDTDADAIVGIRFVKTAERAAALADAFCFGKQEGNK